MSMSALMHFDPSLPLGLTCDASGSGIGAVLYHISWRNFITFYGDIHSR